MNESSSHFSTPTHTENHFNSDAAKPAQTEIHLHQDNKAMGLNYFIINESADELLMKQKQGAAAFLISSCFLQRCSCLVTLELNVCLMQLDVQQADSACLGAPSELSKHDQSGTEHSIRPQREASSITEQRTKVVFFLANGTVRLTEQE